MPDEKLTRVRPGYGQLYFATDTQNTTTTADSTSDTSTSTIAETGDLLSMIFTNIGTGVALYNGNSVDYHAFRTIKAGTNIGINIVDDTLVLSTLVPGDVSNARNIGGYAGVFSSKNGDKLEFKTLIPGTGIDIISGTQTLTILNTLVPGETNTASNIGNSGSYGIYQNKVGVDFRFKSMRAGSNLEIQDNGSELIINAINVGEINTASNLGQPGSYGVYQNKIGADFKFRNLRAGQGITLSLNADNEIQITNLNTPGEINTASNSGTGVGIYRDKIAADLRFKSLKAGNNVVLTDSLDEIVIGMQNPGEQNTGSNLGSVMDGAPLYAGKTGVDLLFKRIQSGNNITITETSNNITINATGEQNQGANLGATGATVYAGKNGLDLQFKRIIGGNNIVLSETTNDITIATPNINRFSQITTSNGNVVASGDSQISFVANGPLNISNIDNNIYFTNTAEINTASNSGVGSPIFIAKNAQDLTFRGIRSNTAHLTVTHDQDSIVLSSTAIARLQDDNAPVLGANLNTSGYSIVGLTNQNITIQPQGTGKVSLDGQLWPKPSNINGQLLATDGAGNLLWISAGSVGEANNGVNLGTGVQLYSGKVGVSLQFKTLLAGNNVSLSDSIDTVTINSNTVVSNDTNPTLSSNLNLNGFGLISGTNISISSSSGTVVLNGQKWPNFGGANNQVLTTDGSGNTYWQTLAVGEINSAVNIGTGVGLFETKSGLNIRLKSLIAGSGIQLTDNSDNIVLTNNADIYKNIIVGTSISSATGANSSMTFAHDGNISISLNTLTSTLTFGINTIGTNKGGTGFASYNPGDILLGTAGGLTKLTIGSSGQVLTSNGTTAVWQNSTAGFLDPMTTAGDIIYRNSGNVTTRLPAGSNGQILTIVSGTPQWANNLQAGAGLSLNVNGFDVNVNPNNGTLISSDTVVVGGGTSGLTLISNGASLPATWQPLNLVNTTGTLPINRGGTGLTSVSTNTILVGTVSGLTTISAPVSTNTYLRYGTVGFEWSPISNNGLQNLVEDTTPQLGGDLDVNGYSITSGSNQNITILPGGALGETVIGNVYYTKKQNATLLDNTANQVIFTYNAAANEAVYLDYVCANSTNRRIGTLMIVNNTATVSHADSGTEIGTIGLTFSTIIVGTNVEVRATTTATGNTTNVAFVARRFDI